MKDATMSPNTEEVLSDKFEITSKSSDYCIVVFVINEGEKLHKQLSRMQPYAELIDIIIADGGSTDGSVDISALEKFGVNTLLIKKQSGKLGTQMRMAFAWALQRGYKGVISIDGNGKDDVAAIPAFIQKLEEGYDHIQGSRFIKGGKHENTPPSRLIGVRLLHAPVMRLASGFHYTDTTNGFRAYSKQLLESPRMAIFRPLFTGYQLHYYIAYRAARCGYKCVEIPVTRKYPKTGKTPTKISPIKGSLNVLQKLFSTVLGLYNPKETHYE